MTKENKRKGGVAKVCVTGALVAGLSVACIPGAIAYSTENMEAVELTVEQKAAPAEYEKTEVVYAALYATGSPKGVYVVNQFDVSAAGAIEDFGAYSTVANLTDQAALTYAEGATSFEAGEGTFYYQGNTAVDSVKLPWDVSISYTLDGVAVSPEGVAGKSGELGVHLTTSRSEGVDPAFAESYMLQITFTLNGDTTTDIVAEGATMASAGRDRTIAFTVLPGKDADCTLTAKVSDFEMAGIQIAALPYAMVMEMPDTGDMESQMQELSDTISEMDAGISDLAEGSAAFSEGLELTAQGAQGLVSYSSLIGQNLSLLSNGLTVENMQEMAGGMQLLASTLSSMADGVWSYKYAVDQFFVAYDSVNKPKDDQLIELRDSESDAVKALLSAYEGTNARVESLRSQINASYEGWPSSSSIMELACSDAAKPGSLKNMAAQLNGIAATISSSDPNAQTLAVAAAGLAEISNQYARFDAGLTDFANGVAELNANYVLINEGTQQFAGGMAQLNQATIKIPASMRAEIEEMMAEYDFPEFGPISFVDSRNDEHMVAVQFVLTTDAIAPEEPESAPEEEDTEQTIVDRFFALFE